MIIVSKATKDHCAGTVQSQGGRKENVKQVGFEPGLEDSYGRCGSDKIRQTIPDASSGDRKSSVATGKARSLTVDSNNTRQFTMREMCMRRHPSDHKISRPIVTTTDMRRIITSTTR